MNDFELHPRLVKDTFAVANLNLCKLLLMNDSNYPWFILVPRIKNIFELFELDSKATLKNGRAKSILPIEDSNKPILWLASG